MVDEPIVYRFGPFELDPTRRVLLRGGSVVDLPDRCVAILILLVSHAPHLVTRYDVERAGWKGSISGESILHAVRTIRLALGGTGTDYTYIETVRGRGYRFVAAVTRHAVALPRAVEIDAIVSPYHALSDAHLAVGTMSCAELERARLLIRSALHGAPDSAAAYIDIATAGILTFEASRMEIVPDFAVLHESLQFARRACEVAPHLGVAWSTLAYAQELSGDRGAAAASAGKAITLDGHDWRHVMRLAWASWGDARLDAAIRIKAICPDWAGSYWLEGTVLMARRAFPRVIESLKTGCALHDAQQAGGPFNAVGLHLMRGDAFAALGRDDQAIEEYRIELVWEDPDHLYRRECSANTHYSIAAVHARNGRVEEALRECREALAIVAGHPLALMLLASLAKEPLPGASRMAMYAVDPILIKVAPLALAGRHADAADLAAELVTEGAPGPQGWLLAADPLIHATAHPDEWAQALRLLHDRATD